MLRKIAVAAAVAALGVALVTTEASARSQGMHGGPIGGFRAGPSFGGFARGPSFAHGPGFVRGPGFARGAFVSPAFRHPGFRHFRRFGFVGLPLVGAYAGYSYYNDCVVPQNVLTPWGYRTRWINVCDYDYPY